MADQDGPTQVKADQGRPASLHARPARDRIGTLSPSPAISRAAILPSATAPKTREDRMSIAGTGGTGGSDGDRAGQGSHHDPQDPEQPQQPAQPWQRPPAQGTDPDATHVPGTPHAPSAPGAPAPSSSYGVSPSPAPTTRVGPVSPVSPVSPGNPVDPVGPVAPKRPKRARRLQRPRRPHYSRRPRRRRLRPRPAALPQAFLGLDRRGARLHRDSAARHRRRSPVPGVEPTG